MLKFLTYVYTLSLILGTDQRCLPSIAELIVGGEATKIQEVPYQAALFFYDYYYCGGCIVSQTHVLTAAHCVEFLTQNHQGLTVRVGSTKMHSGGQLLKVKKVSVHPKFSREKLDYDIGVIEVKNLMKLSETVRPLEIGREEPKEGEEVRVSGWGYLKEIGPASRKLRSVLVKIVDRKECVQRYKNIVPVTKRMVCAWAEDKDACYGDSGGALVHKDKVIGIVSSGEGCARKEYPGIYTNIVNPEIQKFIKNETKL